MLRAVVVAAWVGLVALTVSGCTKSEPAAESAACCTNEATGAPADPTSESATTARSVPLVASDLHVSGAATRDGVTLSVQNHSAENVKLKSVVRVEHHVGERWVVVPAPDLLLRMSCDANPAECFTLAPGGELLPPGWPARQGRGACGACETCPDVVAGEYRFVVDACDGGASVPSQAFTVVDVQTR